MVLNVVLLDNDEKFIKFLDPDLIQLEETCEQYKLGVISMTYQIDDPAKAKELFKMGHKIWVNGDDKLKDCLYVINDSLKNDYFMEDNVEFEAEDVLTELNYAPLFAHTSIPSRSNYIFTIDSKGAVVVDRNALEAWFGKYFNIGVMQPCLTTYLQKISPIGTMTLMELLRFIEEETSNVFVTRYEKDKETNVIHRYLDFLNPSSKKDVWNLRFEYHVPMEYGASDSQEALALLDGEETIHNEREDEGDNVIFDKDDLKLMDVTDFVLNVIENDEILESLSASEIGLNGRSEEYLIDLNYSESENSETHVKEGNLNVNVIGYSYDETLASNPNSTTHMSETDNNPAVDVPLTLGKEVTIQLIDSESGVIIHEQNINPILNKTVGDVLDLGFNVENITFETDESDTFRAAAPKLSLGDEDSSSSSLNKTDLGSIINDWVNLSVVKGTTVPMIVEKVSLSTAQKDALGNYNLENNYFKRPLKPQDNIDSSTPANSTFEYFIGTAYWKAPFSKISGEIYVADDEDTGVEYDHVNGKKDIPLDEMEHSTPKLCTAETSDEDVYAIYNAVCMKLKDKRFPDLNIEVDVKNYNKNKNNSYDIFDKVYVKLPNVEELIVATVNKTVKNGYDVGENKVELSNYSNTIKVSPAHTMIDGNNLNYAYPNQPSWTVSLINLENEAEVSNKLITFTLYKVEENNTTLVKSYNRYTDDQGNASLILTLEPGDYQMKVNFGGDAELSSAGASFTINVYGTIIQPDTYYGKSSASKKNKNKTITKTSYYSKYGVSPDEKSILAIGKASTAGEKRKYGTSQFWKTKFIRKCHCGSTKLFWGWNWGSKFRNKKEAGSSTGRIICEKCGASYTVFGEGGKHDLTRIDPPTKSSKTDATKLKNGKYVYDTWKVTVNSKSVSGNGGDTISRSPYNNSNAPLSGTVTQDVRNAALNIVKNKTGVKAAKALADWVSKNIKTVDRDFFYQSPSKTLSTRKGSDGCKADLLLQMCDAAGVMSSGISCYYVLTSKLTRNNLTSKNTAKTGAMHMFCRINGVWVDPTKKSPWGHYKTGYGPVNKAEITRYPYLPTGPSWSKFPDFAYYS